MTAAGLQGRVFINRNDLCSRDPPLARGRPTLLDNRPGPPEKNAGTGNGRALRHPGTGK